MTKMNMTVKARLLSARSMISPVMRIPVPGSSTAPAMIETGPAMAMIGSELFAPSASAMTIARGPIGRDVSQLAPITLTMANMPMRRSE